MLRTCGHDGASRSVRRIGLASTSMAAEGTFAGRSLPDPGFAGDDGSAPEAVLAAVASGDGAAVVGALLTARVLVPVVAVLDEVDVGADGLAREKSADMAVVTIRSPSGLVALPVFTSTDALAAWSSEARPVPVAGVQAARAAQDEGADVLLLDPGGPTRFVIEGPLLVSLAAGRTPLSPVDDPDVLEAVARAAASAGIAPDRVKVEQGDDVDLVVRLTVAAGAADDVVIAAAQSLSAGLASDPVIQSRLPRGLDVALDRSTAAGG